MARKEYHRTQTYELMQFFSDLDHFEARTKILAMMSSSLDSCLASKDGSKKRKRPSTFQSLQSETSTFKQPNSSQSQVPLSSIELMRITNPQSFLISLLHHRGLKCTVRRHDEIQDFFHELRKDEVDSYGIDVIQAVRDADIEKLRHFHRQGRPLKCSNRFGESLLHLACRRSLTQVVDFFVNEIGVPVCVKDDMGRTPLTDAFWTSEPNPELVDILVRKCPDLLLICDKRGHAPLAYSRQEHWSTWNEYLESRSDLLTPKRIKSIANQST